MKTLTRHPLSAAFPDMTPAELGALKSDIEARGLLEPITLYEGMILDGWHRYQACLEADHEPWFEDFSDKRPDLWVISKNARRRHLSKTQIAVAIAKIAEITGMASPVRHSGGSEGQAKSSTSKSATVAGRDSATVEEMAEAADVDKRTMERAQRLVREGVADQVLSGELGVREAEAPFAPPPKERSPLGPEYEDLLARYQELQDQVADLTDLAASAKAFEEDDQFKEMQKLRSENRALRGSRDELLDRVARLTKELKNAQAKDRKNGRTQAVPGRGRGDPAAEHLHR